MSSGWCLRTWVCGGSTVKNKPQAGHVSIHDNSKEQQPPTRHRHTDHSVELLTSPILTRSTNEGGREREKSGTQMLVSELQMNCTTTRCWNTPYMIELGRR